jgi:hypothetical protein
MQHRLCGRLSTMPNLAEVDDKTAVTLVERIVHVSYISDFKQPTSFICCPFSEENLP